MVNHVVVAAKAWARLVVFPTSQKDDFRCLATITHYNGGAEERFLTNTYIGACR